MSLKNSKRKEIVKSVMSLGLCGVLLSGGTLAYFTKTLTSTGNSITTQKFDLAVNGSNEADKRYTLINIDKLEEGVAKEIPLKIENAGELAFNYKLNMTGNIDTEDSDVAKAIEVKLVDKSNNNAVVAGSTMSLEKALGSDAEFTSSLGVGGTHDYALSIELPTNNTTGYDADKISGKTIDNITLTITADNNK